MDKHTSDKVEILNLDEVNRFDNLLVFAKSIVDGYFSGRHKAINYGSSSQFKDYRAYQHGDDLTHVDWRLYARTKKLFTKRHDNETDMIVYLMVDMSASMGFGEKDQNKSLLASRIAATLAYLMINQGDKVSLVLFNDKVHDYQSPGGTRSHLYQMISAMEGAQPSSHTDLNSSLHECQGLFKKRGRIVILSDFWEADDELFENLSLFIHKKYEVLLMQIMDPDEMELPQYDNVRFVDMESGEEIQLEPDEIRSHYKKNMQEFFDRIARESEAHRIQYSLINSQKPYLEAIESYLGFRRSNTL